MAKKKPVAKSKMVALPGSAKVPVEGARIVAPARPDERMEVTVRLRPKKPLPSAADLLAAEDTDKSAATPRKFLLHEQYEKLYGTDPKDFERVRKFAASHQLTVVHESIPRRSVMLSGTVADFENAFNVTLHVYEHERGTYRGRVGQIYVPPELDKVVEGVFGLDNRRVAYPHFRLHPRAAGNAPHPFNPTEVATIYNFPTGVNGTGQCIGIIELGGGYRPADLNQYFAGLGINPPPTVIPFSVDGAHNSPTNTKSADVEVVLDIEVAGAVAPGAKIVVYFAPNSATGKGFLDAITAAIHDSVNNPSVISISWGGPEVLSNDSFQTQFTQALHAAALLGITVCIASGDNGAADMGPVGQFAWDGKAHVDFPASSPFALACGGTRLIAQGNAIESESVWNQHFADTSPDALPDGSFGAGGGGVSGAFPLPPYQQHANVPTSLNPVGFEGRGVPDVTGDGDPETGYNIRVDGQAFPIGGTSAVAPLWAGLIALINQKLQGRVGFINPQLYALPANSGAFHDIVLDNNRVSFGQFSNVGYDAGPGWDACSGLGSPNGAKLAQLLRAATPSP